MQLIVKGQQIDVGDALREHVRQSLTNVFGKYFGDAIDATVTFSREAHLLRASLTVPMSAAASRPRARPPPISPMPPSIIAADRLAKRLRRHKRRLRDHHKQPVGTAPEKVQLADHYVLASTPEGADDGAAGADEDGPPTVVAEMKAEILALTVSEAVMRLDLADRGALMFVNRAHGGLNMVYRRPDGNIGWVDPKGNRGA